MASNGAQPAGPRETTLDKQIFTTGEAARICNVSQQTIIRCFDRGRLSGFKVPGSKFRRIPRAELVRFMQDNDIPLDRLGTGRTRALAIGRETGAVAAIVAALRADDRFDVRIAETALDAGLELGAFRPDVALVGPGVPGADAPSVAMRLRERNGEIATRVVALDAEPGAALRPDSNGVGDRIRALLAAGEADAEQSP